MAGLLNYFKLKRRNEGNDDEGKSKGLPVPNGELSKVVPSSSIEVINAVVNEVLEKEHGPCGPYISVTPAKSMPSVKELLKMESLQCFIIMLKDFLTFH